MNASLESRPQWRTEVSGDLRPDFATSYQTCFCRDQDSLPLANFNIATNWRDMRPYRQLSGAAAAEERVGLHTSQLWVGADEIRRPILMWFALPSSFPVSSPNPPQELIHYRAQFSIELVCLAQRSCLLATYHRFHRNNHREVLSHTFSTHGVVFKPRFAGIRRVIDVASID
jgi:hypothetical protein